jgi:D-sedoheptulose 7-phosphate isomerase
MDLKDPRALIGDSVKSVESLLGQVEELIRAARLITVSVRAGGRVYLFGNGGSAADAQHIAAELVGRFELERKGIPAIALTTDTSVLTSVSNDYGFETVFERQVEAHVRQGDVVVGITTSGTSPNVVRALRRAKELGAATVLLTGAGWANADAARVPAPADAVIAAGSENTARIQEAHIVAGHVICHLVEDELYGATGEMNA